MQVAKAAHLVVLIHSYELSSSLCIVCSILPLSVMENLSPVSRGIGQGSYMELAGMDKRDLVALRQDAARQWDCRTCGSLCSSLKSGSETLAVSCLPKCRVSHVKPVWQWHRAWLRNKTATED